MAAAKTILITGSSAGIGRATAELFQRKGWRVAATMRAPAAGKELAALDNVLVTALNVTNEAAIDAAIADVIARFGSIDALVNNAGFEAYGVLEATTVESMHKQFDTNVMEFSNDSSIDVYQPLIAKLWEVAGALMEVDAESEAAAEVIYAAATDASDRTRFTVGDDAKRLAAQRSAQDDETFFCVMHAMFAP